MARSAAGRWNSRRSTRLRPRSEPAADRRSAARWRSVPSSGNAAAGGSNGASKHSTHAISKSFQTLAIADGGGSGLLRARLGPDGRVERALRAGEDEERRWARQPGDGGWIESIGTSARAVYLFGAGHVGRALALALAPLPFAVRWIDPRRDAFPAAAPANVALVFAPEPAAEVAGAPDGALIVVMTHSHALDLEVVAAALKAGRFGFVGLIGSSTKRARFLSQMRSAGLAEAALARLVCPIGVPGLESKDPAAIAASTAVQLLIVGDKVGANGGAADGEAFRQGLSARGHRVNARLNRRFRKGVSRETEGLR